MQCLRTYVGIKSINLDNSILITRHYFIFQIVRSLRLYVMQLSLEEIECRRLFTGVTMVIYSLELLIFMSVNVKNQGIGASSILSAQVDSLILRKVNCYDDVLVAICS